MPVLTAIDLARIQQYVFSSNRLRDVLAASYAVEQALDPAKGLQAPEGAVILAGGGNALLQFESLGVTREWTRDFTRRLQQIAPGIEVVIAHRPFDPGHLAQAWLSLHADLARQKLERRPSVPQAGLSVTATCAVTGLPASAVDEDGQLVSSRIELLRSRIQDSKNRWKRFLPAELENAPDWTVAFPDDLDELGRSPGETSLIGVVHVDGNGVGELIRQWLCRRVDAPDKRVQQEAQEWSSALRRLAEDVLSRLVGRITACIRLERQQVSRTDGTRLVGQPEELSFPLHQINGVREVFLPLRPIVLGGDDMTFVADGRIALDLAVAAIREFEKNSVPHLGENGLPVHITACAGVALVRSHAPFYRAYEAAKILCSSAKSARKEARDDGGWVDWMVGTFLSAQSVKEWLAAYRASNLKLTMRPYPVTRAVNRRSWDWLDLEVLGPGPLTQPEQGFRGDLAWRLSRNRVKQLGALTREGPEAVRRQLSVWRATQPDLKLPGGLGEDGFVGNATPMVDAIEIMDLHLRLEPPRSEAGAR
jgi:hypothetical protein